MDITNVARRSYMMGYLNQELHVLNMLNIKGSHRNLAAMSPTEKNQYLWNYSQYVHRSTDSLDVFYSNFNKTRTILFHALESRLVYFGHRIESLFVAKFYHDRNNKIFLKNLQYIGEYDKIDKKNFSEFPDLLGRKLYEYRKSTGDLKTISLLISDHDWPMPDTYFRTIGATVRGFSFLFPNASDKLKENFVLKTNLLNIESGTDEIANVLTQNNFFPEQKPIKDSIDEYNGVPIK